MDALNMYSDSDDDDQDEPTGDPQQDTQNSDMNHSISPPSFENDECDEYTYITPTEPPIIPSSPESKPAANQSEHIANLLKKYKDHQTYIDSTFNNLDFEENPKFTANKMKEIKLFEGDEDTKLNEYSSALSLKIFNPKDHLKKEDNVDTLIKALEEKIRENDRKMQEKKERREHQKQIKQQSLFLNQPKYSMESIQVLNAAKQAVRNRQHEILSNKKRNKKTSRWDDK